jgi:hypothetical protein
MSSSFKPKAYVARLEEVAKANGWTIRYLSKCGDVTRPWLQRTAILGPISPSLYLSAGIHGDEISGPMAILKMLRDREFFADFNVTIFPILNPDGLAQNLRGNAAGIDLNRDYRNSKSQEILSHIEALKTLGQFDAAMMLHEDFEGIGAYLYELNDDPTLSQKIIAAMGQHVPIDLRPVIEEVPATGGVISRKELLRIHGNIEDRPDWPEAIYLSVNHTKISYTTETPKPFPLENRIEAQIAAVRTLMDSLSKAPSS